MSGNKVTLVILLIRLLLVEYIDTAEHQLSAISPLYKQ